MGMPKKQEKQYHLLVQVASMDIAGFYQNNTLHSSRWLTQPENDLKAAAYLI
jgi:hypothetical protein